jgi:hypothetical protein
MATFQNTVTIAWPTTEVFAFLADFGNIPAWGGTRLTNHVELEPSSALLRPLGPLAVPGVKAAVARNRAPLRRIAAITAVA